MPSYDGYCCSINCFEMSRVKFNIVAKRRLSQLIGKWKTISIFWKIEDDLNILARGKLTQYFDTCQMTKKIIRFSLSFSLFMGLSTFLL
jgi:hypothetical protein